MQLSILSQNIKLFRAPLRTLRNEFFFRLFNETFYFCRIDSNFILDNERHMTNFIYVLIGF